MSRRLVVALPLLVAACLLAIVTGQAPLVGLMAAPVLVACVRSIDAPLSTPAQVLLLLGCGMGAFVLTTFWPAGRGMAEEALEPGWSQLAQAALLLAGARLHVRAPLFGVAGTLGLGLLVFLACGTVRTGVAYPMLLGAYAVLAFVALRSEDVAAGGRPSWRAPGRRVTAAVLLVLGISIGMTASLAVAIPRFYLLAYDWALEWVDGRQRAGFHDGPLRIGSLDGLLQSDDVVMRAEGDVGGHLRGNVYTHYARGRWLPAPRRDERALRTAEADRDTRPGGEVRGIVRHARDGVDRFFVPSEPGAIRLAPVEARVDEMGVVRTKNEASAETVVLLGTGARSFESAPPRPIDRQVPDETRPLLDRLQAEWTRGVVQPVDRVAAIEARLETDYVYSLEAAPDGDVLDGEDVDPLVAFLTRTRAGHCEYFATAMTLLARASGVPARLVTGYRVAERNPFGHYAVVRERHAHAWTEVYLDGAGWVTVDPAPLRGTSPAPAEVTPWLSGLVDWTVVALQRRGLEALLVLLVVGLAAAQIARILRDRGRRDWAAGDVVAPPPEWLTGLLEGLEASGLPRRDSEPLESLARRARTLAQTDAVAEDDLSEAAVLLGRYAAARYGDDGSIEALRDDFMAWVERARPAADGVT